MAHRYRWRRLNWTDVCRCWFVYDWKLLQKLCKGITNRATHEVENKSSQIDRKCSHMTNIFVIDDTITLSNMVSLTIFLTTSPFFISTCERILFLYIKQCLYLYNLFWQTAKIENRNVSVNSVMFFGLYRQTKYVHKII